MLQMVVAGGLPWYFGGYPGGDLPLLRYTKIRARADFASTGAWWEMTGSFDRWTGGRVGTDNSNNLTDIEKSTFSRLGPATLQIDNSIEPCQYRLGGSGPFRAGIIKTSFEESEPLDGYFAEMTARLSELTVFPTAAIVFQANNTVTGASRFPIARYGVRPGGIGLIKYLFQGAAIIFNPELIRLSPAMASVLYNNLGYPDPGAPVVVPIAHPLATLLPALTLQLAKVKTGILTADERITRAIRWSDDGLGFFQITEQISLLHGIAFPNGIVGPPDWSLVKASYATDVIERRSIPPHI